MICVTMYCLYWAWQWCFLLRRITYWNFMLAAIRSKSNFHYQVFSIYVFLKTPRFLSLIFLIRNRTNSYYISFCLTAPQSLCLLLLTVLRNLTRQATPNSLLSEKQASPGNAPVWFVIFQRTTNAKICYFFKPWLQNNRI